MDLEKMMVDIAMAKIPTEEINNEDWFTEDDYKKLSHEELIEHNIKKDKRIKKLKARIEKLKRINEQRDYDYQQMTKRIIEHRKQLSYKDWTLTLYKRILEKLCLRPNDEK